MVLVLQRTRAGTLHSGNIRIGQLAALAVTRRLLLATLGRTTLLRTALGRVLRRILSGFLLHAVERARQLLQGETALLTNPVALGDLSDLVLTLSNLRVSLLAGSLGNTLNLLLKRKLSGLRAARTLAALTLLAGRSGLLRSFLTVSGCGSHRSHSVTALSLLRLQSILLLLVTRILAGSGTATLTVITLMAVDVIRRATATTAQRLIVNHQATTGAVLTGLREDLKQTGTQALAGHLNQTQRSHLSHLMLGAVTAQALNQATQNQVTVRLKHHVNEVNDDNAANIAQTQLTDNLLSSFQVVLGDSLFQVAAATGELTGVHVHHGHGFGTVNHQRTTRGQVHLTVQCLRQLLVDAVVVEEVVVAIPLLQAGDQVRRHVGHVRLNGIPCVLALNDHRGEVLVEDVTHGLNHQVGLLVEHLRSQHLAGVSLLLNLFPLRTQTVNVVGQLLLRSTLRRGTNNHASALGQLVLQNLLQASTLSVGQLAGNTGHRTTRHVHQEATGQGNLAGQAGTLVTNRVLGDLHQNRIAGLQGVLNLAGCTVQTGDIPVDLARVQHSVAAASNVNERSFHGRQNVLNLTQVHVANQGILLGLGHEVLSQHAVLEHTNLDAAVLLTNQHLTVHGLAASQELSLSHDVAAATQGAGLAAAHTLRLQAGRTAHTGHSVGCVRVSQARCTHLGDGLNVIINAALNLNIFGTAATATATVARHLSLSSGLLAAALHALLTLLLLGSGAACLTLQLGGNSELTQLLRLGSHEQRHRTHGGTRAQLLQLFALQIANGLDRLGSYFRLLNCGLFCGGCLRCCLFGCRFLGYRLLSNDSTLSLLLSGDLGLLSSLCGGYDLNLGGLFLHLNGRLSSGFSGGSNNFLDLRSLLDGFYLRRLLDSLNLCSLLRDSRLSRLLLSSLKQAIQSRSNLGLRHNGSGNLRCRRVLSLSVTQVGQASSNRLIQGNLRSLLLLRATRTATLSTLLGVRALANILTQSLTGLRRGVLLLREGVQRLKNPKFDVLLVRH